MTLKLVYGSNKPKAYRATKGEAEQWVCAVCEQNEGVATSTVVTITQSPMVRGGKRSGGIKVDVCLHCLLKGRLIKA